MENYFKFTLVDLGERCIVLCTINSSAPLCHPSEVLSWKEINFQDKSSVDAYWHPLTLEHSFPSLIYKTQSAPSQSATYVVLRFLLSQE